jgi:hypothetical protein
MDHTYFQSYRRFLLRAWRLFWPVMRQIVGWLFILLGLLGLALPILQGVLFLVIGVALVGRRNIVIRRSSIAFKRFLRRWARLPTPVVGPIGRMALKAQHQYSRQSRHLHGRYHTWAQRRAMRRAGQLGAGAPETSYDRTIERV